MSYDPVSSSYGANEKHQAKDHFRRGSLTRGRGGRATDTPMASGDVTCVGCAAVVDAGSTYRTGSGMLCELCHVDAELMPAARAAALKSAGLAAGLGGGAVLLGLPVAVGAFTGGGTGLAPIVVVALLAILSVSAVASGGMALRPRGHLAMEGVAAGARILGLVGVVGGVLGGLLGLAGLLLLVV